MPSTEESVLTVALPNGRGYPIHFAILPELPGKMEVAGLRPGPVIVVTAENVADRYLKTVVDSLSAAAWLPRSQIVRAGERSKSSEVLTGLYDWALSEPLDRQTPVLALGGGVVGDLAGFLAATLLRGLPLVQIPTSLVAQVDSSIGGKTGINHSAGKNLIGAFHQPSLVLTDTSTLATLPERDYTSGLAEVVKHALIADANFFTWLEARWDQILSRAPSTVDEMVRRAATIKAHIVEEDELELGRRKILNFGHTFGHALEKLSGYGAFTHGEAVALGMHAALHLSSSVAVGGVFDKGSVSPAFEAGDTLVSRIPITPTVDNYSLDSLVAAMQSDKKRDASDLYFVVLERIGDARLVGPVPAEAVQAAWNYALSVSRAQ